MDFHTPMPIALSIKKECWKLKNARIYLRSENMKIPKCIDKLIKRRTKLAERLMEVCTELDDWLDKNDIECDGDYTRTGCMIYCEPIVAEKCVREDILQK